MKNRSRNIGEGGQQIDRQPFPESVVFQDGPKEQVFVDLESAAAADDGIVVEFGFVFISEKIDVGQRKNEVQFFDRLKLDSTAQACSVSLEGSIGIVIDRSPVSEKNVRKDLFCELGDALKSETAGPKTIAGINFVGKDAVKTHLCVPGQLKAKSEEIERFEHFINRIVKVETPVERFDPVEKF